MKKSLGPHEAAQTDHDGPLQNHNARAQRDLDASKVYRAGIFLI
jgi:hypothetical protein